MSETGSRRDGYLRQAEQAEDLARRAKTQEERQSFEDIARLWRRLADRPERPSD